MSLPLFALILPTHLTAHLRYCLRSIQLSPFAILFTIHLGKACNGRQGVVGQLQINLFLHLWVLHVEDGVLAGSGPFDGGVSRVGRKQKEQVHAVSA
ncbi:hypothetical protein EDB89DRAFT_2057787 [Lactarius sanguifluus]|nr:hypothetical protein EDB89DRAFT_2057787 [Lactarius sanguifluus]